MYYLVNDKRKSTIGESYYSDLKGSIGVLGGQEFVEYHELKTKWNDRGDRKWEVFEFRWRRKVGKNGKLLKKKFKTSLM